MEYVLIVLILGWILFFVEPKLRRDGRLPSFHKQSVDNEFIDSRTEVIELKEHGDQIYMSKEDKLIYMQSKQWFILKAMLLMKYKYKCQICDCIHSLEAHHLTYERLGDEWLSELALLCRDCHQAQHEHYGYDRTTMYEPIIRKE